MIQNQTYLSLFIDLIFIILTFSFNKLRVLFSFSICKKDITIETPTTKVASPDPYGLTGGILE